MTYLIPGQRPEPLPPAYSQAPPITTTTAPSNATQSPTNTSLRGDVAPQSSNTSQTQPQQPAPIHPRFLDHDDLNLDHDPERAEPPPAYTPSRPARVRAMFTNDASGPRIYNHHNRVEMTINMYKTQRDRRRWYIAGALLALVLVLSVVASHLSGNLNNND